MKQEELIAKLIREYEIESDQVYSVGTDFDKKLIIKKVGMDRIENKLADAGWSFDVELSTSHPYGGKAQTIVKAIAERNHGEKISTLAGTNPDNCFFHHYVEVAEKRARHRLILKVAKLSEHHVHSEAESHAFTPEDIGMKKSSEVTKEAFKWSKDEKPQAFSKNAVMSDISKLQKKLEKIEKENDRKKKESVREVLPPEKGTVDADTTDRGKSKSRRRTKGTVPVPDKGVAKK
jgi:hypothetical protein